MVTESSYTLGGWKREFNADHTVKPLGGLQNYYGTMYYYINGVKQTGWQTVNGNTYYFYKETGEAASMWMIIGGKVYYFYSPVSALPYALKTSGSIGGIAYTYDTDGSITKTGFINLAAANTAGNNTAAYIQRKDATAMYYENGTRVTGWKQIGGNWYYFYKESGYMCTESRTIGGIYHYQIAPDGRVLYGLYFTLSPDKQSYYLSGIDIKSSTDIVVPSTYNGLPVTAINDYAMKEQQITSITIPDSVTHIGSYAFYGCTSLTSAVIGNNVSSISYSAFAYCYNLSSVTLGSSVRNIGAYAFYGTAISNIILPSSVTGISAEAFGGCTLLSTVYYRGSRANWENINIDSNNEILIGCRKVYSYAG